MPTTNKSSYSGASHSTEWYHSTRFCEVAPSFETGIRKEVLTFCTQPRVNNKCSNAAATQGIDSNHSIEWNHGPKFCDASSSILGTTNIAESFCHHPTTMNKVCSSKCADGTQSIRCTEPNRDKRLNGLVPTSIPGVRNILPSTNSHSLRLRHNPARLYFSGITNSKSANGAYSWFIVDANNSVIGNGSKVIKQSVPSRISLELEGLLNGLEVALQKGLSGLVIRGCSEFIIRYFGECNELPYFSTMYRSCNDTLRSVWKLLASFRVLEYQIITEKKNYFANKLARNALAAEEKQNDVWTSEIQALSLCSKQSTSNKCLGSNGSNTLNSPLSPTSVGSMKSQNQLTDIHSSISSCLSLFENYK